MILPRREDALHDSPREPVYVRQVAVKPSRAKPHIHSSSVSCCECHGRRGDGPAQHAIASLTCLCWAGGTPGKPRGSAATRARARHSQTGESGHHLLRHIPRRALRTGEARARRLRMTSPNIMSASPTEDSGGGAQKRKNDEGASQPRAKRNRYISIAW
jgi:hypothetical protein